MQMKSQSYSLFIKFEGILGFTEVMDMKIQFTIRNAKAILVNHDDVGQFSMSLGQQSSRQGREGGARLACLLRQKLRRSIKLKGGADAEKRERGGRERANPIKKKLWNMGRSTSYGQNTPK